MSESKSDLRVTVLGCAGSYPGPGQACSGYLGRSAEATVVVDLGPGTLATLQDHVEPADVTAVVLSHDHPDHWLDLPTMRNAMRYYLGVKDLPVYGTAATHRKAEALIEEFAPTLVWHQIDATSRVQVGDLVLRFSRTDHPVETLAMRIDQGPASGGRSLAYSADTGPGWEGGPELIEGVDLFLCEATVGVEVEPDGVPHLSGRQAGDLARRGHVGRLVLTHIAPGVDPHQQQRDAAAVFDGPIEWATISTTFTV